MNSSSRKLFSWIDIEDILLQNQEEISKNDWFLWARIFWDGLYLGIREKSMNQAEKWLGEFFLNHYDNQNKVIKLESLAEGSPMRFLSVYYEEGEKNIDLVIYPSFSKPSIITNLSNIKNKISNLPDNSPQIIAFHSYKGGVGRTLSAMGLALQISQNNPKKQILLIDGDLEAPGLSLTVYKRIPDPPISYADLLSIVHGDPDSSYSNSIKLIAHHLKNSSIDNIYILPAYRNKNQSFEIEIAPENISKNTFNPYLLTDILSKLGRELDVSLIIIDLRAGLSELSAGIILDPRIQRFFITTLNPQSIEGTCNILKMITGRLDFKLNIENNPLPKIIINQIPKDLLKKGEYNPLEENILLTAQKEINEAIFLEFLSNTSDYESHDLIVQVSHKESLITIGRDWDDIKNDLKKSDLLNDISSLTTLVPLNYEAINILDDFREKRNTLSSFANKMITSEKTNISEFLSTQAIQNLVNRYATELPISVIIGPKGSGKTYMYNQIALRGDWSRFTEDAVGKSQVKSLILPIIQATNNDTELKKQNNEAKNKVCQSLGKNNPGNEQQIVDLINYSLKGDLNESDWRSIWLRCISASAGYELSDENCWKNLFNDLENKKLNIIGIIDGLEDLFQDIHSNLKKQVALRSLLQYVPNFLEQNSDNRVGLLIFVRQDLVERTIIQNLSQFLRRYEPYQLKWKPLEALKLVIWIINRSMILQIPSDLLNKEDLTNSLIPVWGRKLGSDNSNESNSADWVIGALSDFKGQIQPRDIARFLFESSKLAISDTFWKDRMLTPAAIRASIKFCSEEKIKEVKNENLKLGEIFDKLSSLEITEKTIPFDIDDANISNDELKLLKENGVILIENEKCYIAEVFRQGLGYIYSKGARPRVIIYSKRILDWN